MADVILDSGTDAAEDVVRRRTSVRRITDVGIAIVALATMAPFLGVVALAIAVSMGRPVLFRQRRSGFRGREFTIVKFRTMRAERYAGEPDTDRITRIGSLLRRTSLDELPQFWNVLRGEMSLIGPRPTLPEQVARYGPHERRRLEVRPGLTGYAQVMGRNGLPWPDRIDLDVWYIDHRSLGLDLVIVLRTVLVMLRRDGISGEGGVNPDFPERPRSETPRPE